MDKDCDGVDKMAEMQNEFLLLNGLDSAELSITIELADSLVADDVEQFLELYDSIPKSVSTERINHIKEMARQLAALPKFDLYRSKGRKFTAGDSASHAQLQLKFEGLNSNQPIVSSEPGGNVLNQTQQACVEGLTNDQQTSCKSKKKKKSKKKTQTTDGNVNAATPEELVVVPVNDTEMKFKLLDSNGSRTVAMNQRLVADISSGEKEGNLKEDNKNYLESDEMLKSSWSEPACTIADSTMLDGPPFGFPLSADQLINSALGLLSEATLQSIDNEHTSPPSTSLKNMSISQKGTDIKELSVSVKVDEFSTVGVNKPLLEKSECMLTCTGEELQSLEDEGWEQPRRSKKKTDPVKSHKECKLSDNTRRNRRGMNRNDNKFGHKGQNQHTETPSMNYKQDMKDGIGSNHNGCLNNTQLPCSGAPESGNNDVKDRPTVLTLQDSAAFSYRDALLKAKSSKTKEDLQYSSDSGVDANSVSSCDSGIQSPVLVKDHFNHKECVDFLTKGWMEVQEQIKKGPGQVIYYNDTTDFHGRKHPGGGHVKQRGYFNRQKGARNSFTTAR
ncbi:uncharacterized protein LOC5516548 isoform X1 [Nematostella vectensis]|uniref:uncharacterized protein LOC5516548 isoform X1 n=2 Tax=Nematostella vectensis TaxID=45351 RepID=UPI002076FBE5|nr:uncharacterized protein LOC5516548 isoform X1 [Nematostella vectensis]